MVVYITFAPPREGKTYFNTYVGIEAMKIGKPVYSNFPILYRPGKLSSLVWEPHFVKETVFDSVIIIDEAYRYFNSRNYKSFDEQTHLFFSLSGQNGNDIYLIAQHPARVDKVIREVVDIFYFVQKMAVPEIRVGKYQINEIPLWFKIESFISEDDLKDRHKFPQAVYKTFRLPFKKDIADSYDTHYYRVKERPFKPVSWRDFIVNTRPDINLDAYKKRASIFSLKSPVLDYLKKLPKPSVPDLKRKMAVIEEIWKK